MLPDRRIAVTTAAIRGDDGAITASLELSTKKWIVTSHSPGLDRLSVHDVTAGDGDALLGLLEQLRAKAERRLGRPVEVITIQEAGLDGFWLHRLLERSGITSAVVDPGSILMPQRRRRAKSDRIDGQVLWRTLAAWLRGEPRVCSMVRPPSPEQEGRRRLVRERDRLIRERIGHTNRLFGLLAAHGISRCHPLCDMRSPALDSLVTGDGRSLDPQLKNEIRRELARLDLARAQIGEVEHERSALFEGKTTDPVAAQLLKLKAIGPTFAATLALEVFFRSFDNRGQLAAYVGLAATPWRSGKLEEEQGISKAGNARVRKTLIELAWMWLRHQPQSALSQWFAQRIATSKSRKRDRRIYIVALARKLVVALWRYVTTGEIPQDAELKTV